MRFRPVVGQLGRIEEAEEFREIRRQANIGDDQRVIHIDAPQGNNEEEQMVGIDQQITRITGAINHLIGTF